MGSISNFGLKEAGYKRFYWLDVVALARALLMIGG